MAQSNPPIEYVPIFNNNNFISQYGVTYTYMKTRYLMYPFAQGNENFSTLVVRGTSFFYNTLTITNGITSNTLSNTDWTGTIKTVNSVQNLTHYLNMSDSSATGQGTTQKSALIMSNPSTGIITSNIAGTLTGLTDNTTLINCISDDTNGSYFLPLVKGTSSTGTFKQLYSDDTSTVISYNPSLGLLTTILGLFNVSQNTATFSGTTLTLGIIVASSVQYECTLTGATNTINTINNSLIANHAVQNIIIFNNGSGNLTISNATLILVGASNYTPKYKYATNVVVPSGSYALIILTRCSDFGFYTLNARLMYN